MENENNWQNKCIHCGEFTPLKGIAIIAEGQDITIEINGVEIPWRDWLYFCSYRCARKWIRDIMKKYGIVRL